MITTQDFKDNPNVYCRALIAIRIGGETVTPESPPFELPRQTARSLQASKRVIILEGYDPEKDKPESSGESSPAKPKQRRKKPTK